MAERPTRSGDYVCDGCGEVVSGDEVGALWCTAPLGLTCLHVHKTQECGRAALAARPEYRMRPGNKPPERKNQLP